MANQKMERLTRDMLIARAQQSREDKLSYAEYPCKLLGATLTIKKLSVSRVCQIMDASSGDDTMEGSMELNKQLIYESVPLFQDKEIQTAYGCVEPYDIVLKVLDDNMGEVNKICSKILSMYGMEELGDDIKN